MKATNLAAVPPTPKTLSHCSTAPTPIWGSLAVQRHPPLSSTGTSSQPSESTTDQACYRTPLPDNTAQKTQRARSPPDARRKTHPVYATTADALGGIPLTATPFAPNPTSVRTWQQPAGRSLVNTAYADQTQCDDVPGPEGRLLPYSI